MRQPDSDSAPAQTLLPHDKEAEQGVLGSIIQDNGNLARVSGTLIAEMFFSPAHRILFETMQALDARHEPIDEITLGTLLRSRNKLDQVGGFTYISELVDLTPSSANVMVYASIVLEKHELRAIITGALDIAAAARKDETVEKLVGRLQRLAEGVQATSLDADKVDLHKTLIQIGERLEKPPTQHLVYTYTKLDEAIPPLRGGYMVYLLSASGHGKSALAFQTLKRNAYMGVPGLGFPLEMSGDDVVSRMLSADMGQDNRLFFNRKAPVTHTAPRDIEIWRDFGKAGEIIQSLPMHIVSPKRKLSLERLRAIVLHHVAEFGVRLVVIDHLRLLGVPAGGRYDEQNYRSAFLRELARETPEVAYLVAAQVNTEGMRYADELKKLAQKKDDPALDTGWEPWHFEGSRDPLQDADDVFTQYDPNREFNGLRWVPEKNSGQGGYVYEAKDVLFRSAKGRNGPGGRVRLTFEPWLTAYDRAYWQDLINKGPIQQALV